MNKNITAATMNVPAYHEDRSLENILRFFRVVRFRKDIMIVALLISFLLAGLYYVTADRVYESKASLLVLHTGAEQWSNYVSNGNAPQDLMSTYQRIVGSEVVLAEAIKKLKPESRSEFTDVPKSKWAKVLKSHLDVVELKGTNVLEVTYSSQEPKVAADVVNCVLSSYLKFMDNLHKGTARELLDILTNEKATLEGQLHEKESELLTVRRQAGDLVICEKSNGLNVVAKRVMRLNELLIAAHEKRLEAQSRAASVKAILQSDGKSQSCAMAMLDSAGREVLLQQLQGISNDSFTISRTNQQLLENRAKLQAALRSYGPAHHKVREIQEKINVAEQYLRDCSLAENALLNESDGEKLVKLLNRICDQQLQQAVDHETRIIASYEEEKARAIELDRSTAELEMLQLDVNRLRGFYDVVLDRIKDIDLSRESGSLRTSVLSRPEVPTSPVSPRLAVAAFCALLFGFSAGLGMIYIRFLFDDHFHSLEEIRAQLGVPVLASVQRMELDAETGIEAVNVHARPSSVESEAFRTLRTTLTFCNKGANRIVVSSSEPGDGKTTVASNLAAVYAQSGKRTLVIDADMRKPGLTTLFDMRTRPGLSTCLAADGPVADTVGLYLQKSVADQSGPDTFGPNARQCHGTACRQPVPRTVGLGRNELRSDYHRLLADGCQRYGNHRATCRRRSARHATGQESSPHDHPRGRQLRLIGSQAVGNRIQPLGRRRRKTLWLRLWLRIWLWLWIWAYRRAF